MRVGRIKLSILLVASIATLSACAPIQWPEFPETDDTSLTPPSPRAENNRERPIAPERAPTAENRVINPAATTTKIRGSGEFINPAAFRQPSLQSDPNGAVTLNFVNTDIREVIRSVIVGILKQNVTIDPAVTGQVTLQTARQLPRSAVIPVLETILGQHGAALIRDREIFKIVPTSKAVPSAGTPGILSRNSPRRAGFGSLIVPLRFASPRAMSDVISPLIPKGAILRVDTDRNLLILAGTSDELESAVELIAVFDVDWFAGMSFAFVKLNHARPTDVISDLEVMFGNEQSSPLRDIVRFVPFQRTNSILVITPQPAYLDRATEWIAQLDLGVETDERRLFLFQVRNGRAVDLAASLEKIYGSGGSSTAGSPTPSVAPGRRPAILNSRQRLGSRRQARARTEQPSESVEEIPRQDPRQPGTAQSPKSSAGDLAKLSVSGPGTGVRVIADDNNNALLVYATSSEYRQIEGVLRRLDIVPLQVLIEATIAEVTLNDTLRYGVQFFLQSGDSSATLSNIASTAIAPSFPGFGYVFASGTDARVVLDALNSVTDVNVISSPQIMVKDNRTATIEVGDQVPIATQSAQSISDPDAPIVNSIQFRDTGVLLKVTPRVNPSGLVNLEIEQEVSSPVQTTTSAIDSPTIRQRRIVSSVAVHDSDTVALGGLIQNESSVSGSGLPLLSQIPLLGALFSSRSKTDNRTELLVLLTPRVVRNRAEAREMTDELRSKVRALIKSSNKLKAGETSP